MRDPYHHPQDPAVAERSGKLVLHALLTPFYRLMPSRMQAWHCSLLDSFAQDTPDRYSTRALRDGIDFMLDRSADGDCGEHGCSVCTPSLGTPGLFDVEPVVIGGPVSAELQQVFGGFGEVAAIVVLEGVPTVFYEGGQELEFHPIEVTR